MTVYPQVLVNVQDVDRSRAATDQGVADAVAAAAAELGDSGRVLLRPSGTEPLVRVMVEAASAEVAKAHAESLAGSCRSGWRCSRTGGRRSAPWPAIAHFDGQRPRTARPPPDARTTG